MGYTMTTSITISGGKDGSVSERISVGDVVSVHFNNTQLTLCSVAVVVYMPQATGDSWVFRDEIDGAIHYVSEGCTVSKKPIGQLPPLPEIKPITTKLQKL